MDGPSPTIPKSRCTVRNKGYAYMMLALKETFNWTFSYLDVSFAIPTVMRFQLENPPPGGAPNGQPLAVNFQSQDPLES